MCDVALNINFQYLSEFVDTDNITRQDQRKNVQFDLNKTIQLIIEISA